MSLRTLVPPFLDSLEGGIDFADKAKTSTARARGERLLDNIATKLAIKLAGLIIASYLFIPFAVYTRYMLVWFSPGFEMAWAPSGDARSHRPSLGESANAYGIFTVCMSRFALNSSIYVFQRSF